MSLNRDEPIGWLDSTAQVYEIRRVLVRILQGLIRRRVADNTISSFDMLHSLCSPWLGLLAQSRSKVQRQYIGTA